MFWAIMVLPRPLLPTRIRLRASGRKVQSQSPFNNVAFDFRGPGPVEIGHRFKLLDLGKAQAPFQPRVGLRPAHAPKCALRALGRPEAYSTVTRGIRRRTSEVVYLASADRDRRTGSSGTPYATVFAKACTKLDVPGSDAETNAVWWPAPESRPLRWLRHASRSAPVAPAGYSPESSSCGWASSS